MKRPVDNFRASAQLCKVSRNVAYDHDLRHRTASSKQIKSMNIDHLARDKRRYQSRLAVTTKNVLLRISILSKPVARSTRSTKY